MAQATTHHPHEPLKKSGEERRRRGSVGAVATLARWQFRQTWRFLLVAEGGILAAVALICLLPLYSSVALSAALRDSLSSSPANAYVVEAGNSALYNQQRLRQFGQKVSQRVQATLQNYVQPHPFFSASMSPLIIQSDPFFETDLDFTGFPEEQIPQHVKLLEGRLPHPNSHALEFVTTPDGLAALQKTKRAYMVGSIFQYPVVLDKPDTLYRETTTVMLPMEDVGVITLSTPADPFWHGMNFQITNGTKENIVGKGAKIVTNIPALIFNEALGANLERIQTEPNTNGYLLDLPIQISWYYPLNLAFFDISHMGDITTRMSHLFTDLNLGGDPFSSEPYVQQTVTLGPMSIFQYYSDRVALLNVPLGVLILLIGGLILLAVSVIVALLVERQEEAIALMRSRGATRGQLVAALSGQGALLALPILVLGPALAYALTIWLVSITLRGSDRNASNVLTAHPLSAMLSVGWIALLVVCIALLVMAFAVSQKLRSTSLQHRREAARSTRPALWQRWRLDLVGVVIALVGVGFALYLTNAGVLNARTRALLLPIVLLGASLGLCMLGVFLLFRFFPKLLRWVAQLTLRSRGATAVLALTQMARGYHQALRMMLLFAVTLAFAFFTLTFNASQSQRLVDGPEFQIGSDFSGILSGPGSLADWQTIEQGYTHIPGIQSAMIGHAGIMQGASAQSIDVLAVDAGTCAQTMDWSAPDSPQSVAPLLQQLVAQRQASIQANLVPALVDTSAAQSLGLTTGSRFSLKDLNGSATFLIIGVVQHIPGILDDSASAGTSDATITGGVLADYATFASAQNADDGLYDGAESMWLKSSDNPTSVASVRQELNNGQFQLDALSDRRAITAGLTYDPLEAAVESWLLAGAAVTLVLGLLVVLLSSWNSARKRLLNLTVMRALGNTPAQIVRIVLWEQGLIYMLALGAGLAIGSFFAWLLLPGLLYTPVINVGTAQALMQSAGLNLTGTGELYLAQAVPAAQVVIPVFLMLALGGIALLVCLLALGIIVRLVTRSTLSETLRVNED